MTEEKATSAGITTATRQRKKRKWDQPAEAVVSAGLFPGFLPFASLGALQGFPALTGNFQNLVSPLTVPIVAQNSSSTGMQQSAAAAVMQKLSQDLVSKGLIPQAKIQDELIAREITINDAEPGVRYKLTKRQTQEEIQVKTGAVVITRGRYRPPNGPVEPEKPLYLHISAGVHLKDTAERIRAVDQAAAMVEEMLKQGRQTPAASAAAPMVTVPTGTVSSPCAVTIYVGFEPEPSYNLVGRIRGPNDQYIKHIMNETGATVTLRGRASGNGEASGEELPQPLHLYITSHNTKSLEDAKVLAENLLHTVRPPGYQAVTAASPPPLAHAPPTYASHPAAYYPLGYTAAPVPHVPYPGYHLPASGGAYPLPYAANQPLYYPPVQAVGATAPIVAAPAPVTAADLYMKRAPFGKAYAAVPPPVQLLEESGVTVSSASASSPLEEKVRRPEMSPVETTSSVYSAQPSTTAAIPTENTSYAGIHTASFPCTIPAVSSHEPLRPPPFPSTIPAQPYQPLTTSQSTWSFPSSQGFSQASSYSGYSGVYPQASPMQQVAQVLQRPPPPVSLKPGSTPAYPGAAPTKAQASFSQEKYPDKQPTQKRKFQEFPSSAGKEASGDEQLGRRGASSAVVSNGRNSREPGVLSSVSMPPPPGKTTMPPPPLQIANTAKPASPPATSPDSSKVYLSSTAVSSKQTDNSHVVPHNTGVKLVEYAEEEEESLERAQSPPPMNGKSLPSFSNGKPFWAA
ncbi:hypothetical protein R1flu_024305 [Riccia fluitans]|uniref:Protein RIK n=1 Tax=Riccia fluitans TaxID=41844 RepID=A0ABD1XYM0_9MARC